MGVVVLLTGATLYALRENEEHIKNPHLQQILIVQEALIRFLRTSSTVVRMIVDWQYTSWQLKRNNVRGKAADAAMSALHARNAQRLLDLCKKQAGVYTKVGQHLCTAPVLPREYSVALKSLMDNASMHPFSDVEKTLMEDFGSTAKELFLDIEKEPFASASLAQVHRGHAKDGRKIAIKVQHRDVARYFHTDISTMSAYYALLGYLIPGFDMQFLVDEVRDHLSQELDFTLEARNAERCKEIFKDDPRIKIPDVVQHLSSKRVLTMEFVEGARIDDTDAFKSKGISVKRVGTLLQEVFCRMLFLEGFVHCDPHPGNILVRYNPKARDQFDLVLLDHGIYKSVSDDFRLAYCRLWKAVILGNEGEIREATKNLGVDPKYSQFVQLVLTMAPPNANRLDPSGSTVKLTMKQRREIMKQLLGSEVSLAEQSQIMESLPRELILLLKTNNLLRFLNEELGNPVNRFRIMAMYSNRGANQIMSKNKGNFSSSSSSSKYYYHYYNGLLAWLRSVHEEIRLVIRMHLYPLIIWVQRWYVLCNLLPILGNIKKQQGAPEEDAEEGDGDEPFEFKLRLN